MMQEIFMASIDNSINAVDIKQIEPIPQITTEFALNVLKQSDEFKNMIMEQVINKFFEPELHENERLAWWGYY
jgi:hypothetical protein